MQRESSDALQQAITESQHNPLAKHLLHLHSDELQQIRKHRRTVVRRTAEGRKHRPAGAARIHCRHTHMILGRLAAEISAWDSA